MAGKNAFYAQSGGVTAVDQRLGLWGVANCAPTFGFSSANGNRHRKARIPSRALGHSGDLASRRAGAAAQGNNTANWCLVARKQ